MVALLYVAVTGWNHSCHGADMSLWFSRPASRWLEALPLGNGRIGVMDFGGVKEHRFSLSETTYWSGAPSDQHENPKAQQAFQKIRSSFKEGNPSAAQPWIQDMLGRQENYGTSLPVGEVIAEFDGNSEDANDYRRELDLETALSSVSFTDHGVHHRRECIVSHPDGVVGIRFTADRPGQISFRLRFQSWNHLGASQVSSTRKDTLEIQSQALEKMHSDGTCGTRLRGLVRIIPQGGTLQAEKDTLRVVNADSAIVWMAFHTDFRGVDPDKVSLEDIENVQQFSWTEVVSRHIADYQRLFHRVSLDLGPSPFAKMPIDERRSAYSKQADKDPSLAALFFQYGRYLTIAGSREDSPLPLHLQGLWNDGLAATMGWTCDYHLDINTQQNYWLSEVGNLNECTQPLHRFIERLQVPGHKTAEKTYGISRGWVCHVFSNVWGFTAPGWSTGWGLHVVGGAWIATHLWEHYQYTQDRRFLMETAYPILKGAAQFFLDYLYLEPTQGFLISGPSVSPEMGGETTPGCVHDQAVIFEVFSACIEASKILGVDKEFKLQCETARAKLPPYKIGRNGQLQEWYYRDDGGETDHRHTSHLVGLFPFAQITPYKTPDFAKAAAQSLTLRMNRKGWEDVEWSAGNAVCYQARLLHAEESHEALIRLITSDTDANLLTYSRGGIAGAQQNIFCIDGNTSGAAGIAEMLLQSHNGEMYLLPALPHAWSSGQVRGLKARGGFTVDIRWKKNQIVDYQIHTAKRQPVQVRVHGNLQKVMTVNR